MADWFETQRSPESLSYDYFESHTLVFSCWYTDRGVKWCKVTGHDPRQASGGNRFISIIKTMECLTQDKLCDLQKQCIRLLSGCSKCASPWRPRGQQQQICGHPSHFFCLAAHDPRHQRELQPLTCTMSHLGLGMGAKHCCYFYFLFMGKLTVQLLNIYN